ncbi:reductase [Nonomuraea sp. NPDC050310]|uniref:reductase n=1 Tax=Nonomuraea sp. NPDC050310 TaxID=3154935 RepID=UPI00340C203D
MKRVCVIGGNRYFGRQVVELLRDEGWAVTLVNRGSTEPPPGVRHLVADRGDVAALRAQEFDVVIDQVCYTPADAVAARQAFGGRVGRYVMTSTIEVYADQDTAEPLAETDPLRWLAQPVPAGELEYGAAKRLAEATLAADPVFPVVTVRSAHVLGGEEWTGRLRHYVEHIRDGREVLVHAEPRRSVFIHHAEIARLLAWAAGEDFTGPLNACSHGELDVFDLCQRIGPARFSVGEPASPFSFGRGYAMSNARAESLGFAFSHTRDWLDSAIEEVR